MRSKILYLITSIFLVFSLTNCEDSLTATTNPDEEKELPTPELVSPTNNSTNQSTQVELNWKRIKGAKEYKIQFSKSEDFESAIVDSMIEGSSYTTPNLETETTYFWRVKPFKRNYEGPWSEVWQFTTSSGDVEPATVELISPDNDTVLETEIPSFEWSSVSESAEYHYQLSKDTDFDNLVEDSVLESTNFELALADSGGTYYWRVSPILDSTPSEWSEVFYFTKEETSNDSTNLTAPELVSPNNESTGISLQPLFEWGQVEGADSYIFYANSTNESNQDDKIVIETEVTGTNFTPDQDLDPGMDYVWSVRAVNNEVEGPLSEVFEFMTTSDGSDDGSTVVSLISPSDGALNQSTSILLDWEEISGINNYQVQLATSSSFSSPIINEIIDNTSFDASNLNHDQTYYWRVQVPDGTENWSNVWSFTTKSENTGETSGSRSGDEAALEAIFQSAGGSGWSNRGGWSSSGMSLAENIAGVTVSSIGGELRVTRIDLKDNGLSGDIETSAWSNLTELVYLNLSFNNLNSNIPSSLGSCTKLEYLYLSRSDDVESKAMDPHEHAQDGGGDVHVGKNKGSENNVWTGAVPASLGNLQQLKWFVLNWTDSSIGATDGITSVPAELFNITTLEGLQIYNNNGVGDLSWPWGIGEMNNLDNLAIGVGKSGNKTGFLTGSVSTNFGNLSELRFLRLGENTNLTLDFDQVDLSGMNSLRNAFLNFIDVRGTFPKYFMDGTLSNLVGFYFNFPQGPGMTGTLSSGATGMKIVQIGYGHDIAGSIPREFWRDNQGLIQTEFAGDNLASVGTTDLTYMDDLRNLRWKNNNIGPEKWPNLNWSDPGQLDNGSGQVQFEGNRYVFSNMLYKPANGGGKTIFQLYKELGLNIFSYKNQQPFGQSRTVNFSVGNDITLDDFDTIVTHSDNVYQWQKNGSDISGATSKSFKITNLQLSDEGTYRLKVTNPGVPGVTLTSEPITLSN